MNKKLTVSLALWLILVAAIAQAENEAVFDANIGSLNIPKVAVGATYYEVDMQLTEGLNFTVTNATLTKSSNDSIVGSWGKGYFPSGTENSGEPEYVSLTFYPNGYYIHYESGQPSGDDNGGGVEIGTYSHDSATNLITIHSVIIDENGGAGLSDWGSIPEPSTVIVSGNTLTADVIFNRVQ